MYETLVITQVITYCYGNVAVANGIGCGVKYLWELLSLLICYRLRDDKTFQLSSASGNVKSLNFKNVNL